MHEPRLCEEADGFWSVGVEDSGCLFLIGQQFCREKRATRERHENTDSMITNLLRDFGKANRTQTRPKQANESKVKKPEQRMGGDDEQSAYRDLLSQWCQNLALLS